MASYLNVSQSTVGVANSGDGIINIGRDLVVGSSSEESFEELDPPREAEVFKGREEDIVKLEALFFGKDGTKKVVIYGLPGFGKTELAVQFAKRCKGSTNIDKVFWVNAETSENLKNLHKTLMKVYKKYEHERCLFIFDNGVSRSSIIQYEPPKVENFYLLITSQIADWGDDIYKMPLEPLNMEASKDVYREILGNRYQTDEEDMYKKMITFVSNAPLGLIVIAGELRFKMDACKRKKFNSEQFLKEISITLKQKIPDACKSSYEKSMYAAMAVVLDKMYKQDFSQSKKVLELTRNLLGTCAYLNPDHLNIKDIQEIIECAEENTVDECMYLSENYSFIEYCNGFIKIHRLSQSILRLYFDENNKDYYSACVRWILTEYYFNWHESTIFREANGKKDIILKIYQQNVSDNRSVYIERLLRSLITYGCCESLELILHKISDEKRKQFVDNMKLLHVAVENNQADVFWLFLKYGDTNVRDSRGLTLLHLASERGNVDIFRILLEKGGDVHVQDCEGRRPLHCASWKGNVHIVRMLLEKGGDVHVQDSEGHTPLHWAGKVDIVRMLLDKGGDMHVQDSEGRTPLHCASEVGNVDIVRMLLDEGGDVNVQDREGRTPLHCASEVGNVDIVRMLLDEGGDVNVQDREGRTPLHCASEVGNVDIVRMLLDEGGDVHVHDSEGRIPLHCASWIGNVDVVRMLLDKGGDVHVQDSEGRTPLHRACASWKGNVDTVRMLLDKGADVNVQDSKGRTPLHCAYDAENVDMVRMLLDKGGDVNVQDSEGKTPLDLATIWDHTDTINILQQLMY